MKATLLSGGCIRVSEGRAHLGDFTPEELDRVPSEVRAEAEKLWTPEVILHWRSFTTPQESVESIEQRKQAKAAAKLAREKREAVLSELQKFSVEELREKLGR